MFIQELLVLLMTDKKEGLSNTLKDETIDYVSDFQKLCSSPNLCHQVLNTFNKKILEKVKNIFDKEYTIIDVVEEKESLTIYKNGEVEVRKKLTSFLDVYLTVQKFSQEFNTSENTVFSFQVSEKLKKIVNFQSIKQNIMKELLICKIDKNEIFKNYSMNKYQFFLEHNNEYFCIWINNRIDIENYINDLALFYILKKNKFNNINFKNIDSYHDFIASNEQRCSSKDYQTYAMEHLYPDDLFVQNDLNDLINFFNSLRNESNFLTLCMSYAKQTNKSTEKKFYAALGYLFCVIDKHESKKTKNSNLFDSSYQEIISVEKRDLILEQSSLFFEYLLKQHQDDFQKHKGKFLTLKRNDIYFKLKNQQKMLERKIDCIILFYNVVRYEKEHLKNIKKRDTDSFNYSVTKMENLLSKKDFDDLKSIISEDEKRYILSFDY